MLEQIRVISENDIVVLLFFFFFLLILDAEIFLERGLKQKQKTTKTKQEKQVKTVTY